VDEQRHDHAHVDGRRGHLGLRQHRSRGNIRQDVLVCGDFPISLHDSSGNDRHGQRSVRHHTPCVKYHGRSLWRGPAICTVVSSR
jgi:hypothetical protein